MIIIKSLHELAHPKIFTLQQKNPLYLGAFKEEGVPDVQVRVDGEAVDKEAEEPVDGEEGGVDSVVLQVDGQLGQLLAHQLLEHGLQQDGDR